MNNKIYLAGPDVFRENAIEHFDEMKKLCRKYGFEGVSPFDTELPKNINPNSSEASKLIFDSNYSKIRECDHLIANLIPFRGACIDDGTVFEIAIAYRLGKNIMGYTPYYNRSLGYISDLTYKVPVDETEFPIIENFGNCCNLMIYEAIKDEGDIVETFEDALKSLSAKIIKRLLKDEE
jgi:nucleoside 2-deoxyribosyltransferase